MIHRETTDKFGNLLRTSEQIIRDLKLEMTMGDLPSPDKLNIVQHATVENSFPEKKKGLLAWILTPVTSWIKKSTVKEMNEDNEMLYKKLQELSKIGVITGSCVLRIYGMLDRGIGDIDLIVDKTNEKLLRDEYIELPYGRYTGDEDLDLLCSLDYSPTYKIDLFPVDDDLEIIEYDGIRMQHPYSVIHNKIKIHNNGDRSKDFQDFLHILKVWKK